MQNQPQNILVIRLSAIGDIVMSSGLIKSLKERYPDASISWLVESMSKSLLQGHEDLHEVIELPRAKWKKLKKEKGIIAVLREVNAMRKFLKQKQFDLVLDTQGLLKSGIWAWFSGAKTRIGLGSKEGSQYLMTLVLNRDSSPVIGSEYRSLALELGCDPDYYLMSVVQSAQTRSRVSELLQEHQLNDFVVLCPYTTRPQKHWFDHHWRELAAQIQLQFGLRCVVLGGPADIDNASALCAEQSNMLSLAGATSLPETAELISRAKYLVGVDTGITHMGIMHALPTVCIFGSTAPYLRAHNAEIIYLNMHCSPCRRNPTCGGRFDCLKDIHAHHVVTAMQKLRDAS